MRDDRSGTMRPNHDASVRRYLSAVIDSADRSLSDEERERAKNERKALLTEFHAQQNEERKVKNAQGI